MTRVKLIAAILLIPRLRGAWLRSTSMGMREVGNGALCHIVQRSGAEGIQSGGCAAAFLPVQPCHRRIQRGSGGGRDMRNRILGNRAQRLE